MDEALNTNIIPTLRKLHSPKDVNTSRKCRYHRYFGHTTQECHTLKYKIEELIQVGHLRKFIQTDNKSSNKSPKREKYPRRDEKREYYRRHHHGDD